MRNAINGTWVFGIMITFMAIFIAYVTIQVNYSNAYKLKTDMITIIEQYDGFNPTTVEKIDDHIKAIGYSNKGYCDLRDGLVTLGVNKKNVSNVEKNPGKYEYCVKRDSFYTGGSRQVRYYYTVDVFFAFNLPLLGNLYNFKVNGSTNVIYYPNDKYFDSYYY